MKKARAIRIMTGILIICFLVASVSSSPVSSPVLGTSISESYFAEKANKLSKSDSGLFDEEKEGEERSEKDFDDERVAKSEHLLVIGWAADTIPAAVPFEKETSFQFSSLPLNLIAPLPLYLAQHTLLI